MTDAEIEQFLQPVSEDAPCGENLEADMTFIELEQASKGEEERYTGTEVIPAKDPEWKEVRKLCVDLLARTKDLRVAVQFINAQTALDGLAGMAQGLTLLRGYLERYWEHVFPQLEAEDDFDPVFRINILAPLAASAGLLGQLKKTVLVSARSVGIFTFRDLDVAEQRLRPRDDETPASIQVLTGALSEAGEDFARHQLAQLKLAVAELNAIDAVFSERASGAGPDLDPLKRAFAYAATFFENFLGSIDSAAAGDAEASAEPGANGTSRSSGGGVGELRNREDAKRILEQVCVYFERHEPSHPAPILIRRAQRLLNMSFLDIIENLAPDALEALQKIAGPPAE